MEKPYSFDWLIDYIRFYIEYIGSNRLSDIPYIQRTSEDEIEEEEEGKTFMFLLFLNNILSMPMEKKESKRINYFLYVFENFSIFSNSKFFPHFHVIQRHTTRIYICPLYVHLIHNRISFFFPLLFKFKIWNEKRRKIEKVSIEKRVCNNFKVQNERFICTL